MSHFDVEDLGKFAAAALLQPERFSGHELELSHEALTLEEAANAIRQATRVDVKTHYRNEQEIEEMRQKVPTQPFQILANEIVMKGNGKELSRYGIPLTSFEEFCVRNRAALREALGQK